MALAALVLACALASVGGRPASAQVVVLVNGDPITAFDIEQRTRLEQMSNRKTPTRQETIDLLIDDKLKVHVAKRYGLEIPEKDVENSFATIAQRMRATPQQLERQLEASGIKAATLKARLRADLTWAQMIRGKFGSSLQIRERDVVTALETRGKDEKDRIGVDYVLRPILFVLPRGSPAAAIEARRREAENLRTRFAGCESGIAFVRALPDVVVRDRIIRNSADLSPQLRAVIDGVEIGHLTPPEVTANGVEVFAVCGKRQTTAESPGKREVREEMYTERFEVHSKRYLKELRSAAMIEYRQ
jgi:peptidyl-prolyl cis-trans isomerase SurA